MPSENSLSVRKHFKHRPEHHFDVRKHFKHRPEHHSVVRKHFKRRPEFVWASRNISNCDEKSHSQLSLKIQEYPKRPSAVITTEGLLGYSWILSQKGLWDFWRTRKWVYLRWNCLCEHYFVVRNVISPSGNTLNAVRKFSERPETF